ncbi:MAG: helix-turn-helix transcriptional regulator, partial [Lachnospiraceae bacterium]|nr:helix-turn-helix transcriptional regulator [Lachnospiraceae bacterium]
TLSKQYLMNPTTLKSMFKSVYGTSIAAHIKKHRMEKAAKLLRETDLSIAEIAAQVGYDSQSKFTSAFKETFGQLPKSCRRQTFLLQTIP